MVDRERISAGARGSIDEETGEASGDASKKHEEREDAHLLMVATPASANQLRRRPSGTPQ